MTRRKFFERLTAIGLCVVLGARWAARKASYHKVVWAERIGKYPGRLKSMADIYKQGKWSG